MLRKIKFLLGLFAFLSGSGIAARAENGLYGGSLSGSFVLEGYPENPQVYATADMLYTTDTSVFKDNTTWVYWGYMYMQKGDYYFLKRNWDDGIYLKIDDVVLINNNTYNDTVGCAYAVEDAGWHKFEIRAGQGIGGVGPFGNNGGFHYWRGSEEGAWDNRCKIGNFDGIVFSTDLFGWNVSGNYEVEGADPAYGFYAFEDGIDSKTFSAPEEVAGETQKLRFLGYEIYATADGNRRMISSGTENTVAVGRNGADRVEIVWLYKSIENKITATALDSAKGTVAIESNEWVAPGGKFKVVANALDGYAFAFWQGDVPEKLKYLNPIELPADGPKNIEAVFLTGVKITPQSGTVQAAIAAVAASATVDAPGVVELGEGVYLPTSFLPYVDPEDESVTYKYMIDVSVPVILRSVTGAPGAVTLDGDYNTRAFIKLAAAGAAVVGVDIVNVSNTAVRVEAGTLANARVSDCWSGEKSDQIVTATGAGSLVHDCEITRNKHERGDRANVGALGLWQMAKARRCVIHSNRNYTSYYSHGAGGVVMGLKTALSDCVVSNNYLKASVGDGGCTYVAGGIKAGIEWSSVPLTIENCLIAGNTLETAASGAGGLSMQPRDYGCAKVSNCTIVGNCLKNTSNGGSGIYIADATKVANTIVADNDDSGLGLGEFTGNAAYTYSLLPGTVLPAGEGNMLGRPAFADAANGDYHLKLYSPGRDAGKAVAAAFDLDGNERTVGAAVDMGAFEIQESATVQIAREQTSVAAPAELTVKAGVGMVPAQGAAWTWKLLKNGIEEVAAATHDSAGSMVDSFVAAIDSKGNWTIRVEVQFPGGETAADEMTLTAIGDTAYVSASGANQAPYDTWETAATSIADAIAAVAPAGSADKKVKVVLAEDEYEPSEAELANDYMVEVPSYVTLKGAGETPEATVLNANGMRGVKLNAGARLENLMVTNCVSTGKAGYAFGIYVNGAEIENCILKGGSGTDTWPVSADEPFLIVGGGSVRNMIVADSIKLCEVKINTGAMVENLTVTNMGVKAGSPRYGIDVAGAGTKVCGLRYAGNRIASQDYIAAYHILVRDGAEICDSEIADNLAVAGPAYSSGIRMVWNRGGTLRRVKICRNMIQPGGRVTSDYYLSAGVWQTDGTIDNSLVAGNRIINTDNLFVNFGDSRAAGLRLAGGSVVNATISGNVSAYDNDVHGVVYSGGTMLNSIVAGNGVDGAGVQIASVGRDSSDNTVQTHAQVASGVTYTLVGPSGDEALDPSGEGVIIDDARFKNAANGDYRLAADSPALKAGQPFDKITFDIEGNERAASKRCDLGCYIGRFAGLHISVR